MTDGSADSPWMGPLPAAPGCRCQICVPEQAYDDLDRQVIDTVLRHGWQVMAAAAGDGCDHPDHGSDGHQHEDAGPAFAYTIGLGHRYGHPELLMSGLERGVMHRALNDVAERVKAGHRLAARHVLEGVLAGVPVVIEEVAHPALLETVTWSGWFHRREPAAFAIVWPTTSGLFAWQPGAPAVLNEAQPPHWRTPIAHDGGVGADPPWLFPVPPDHLTFTCSHVLDEGAPVLWVAREADPERGEDWTVHCGGMDHATGEMRVVHLAHLVRSAPTLRGISELGIDEEALRADPDSPWATGRLAT